MATLRKQYTFVADTTIQPSEVNVNLDDIVAFINNYVMHVDGSREFTGIPVLPDVDPTHINHAVRRKYVDDLHYAENTARQVEDAALFARIVAIEGHFRQGFRTGNTNGAGDIVVEHGLGVVPEHIGLTIYAPGAATVRYQATVENRDASTINVRFFDTQTGAALANAGVSFYWEARKAGA